jgi:7-keto-8-aminopelargonate synthetase-like enzyme
LREEAAISLSYRLSSQCGMISAMVNKDEFMITDKYDHASIIDGVCCLRAL